MKKIMHTLFLCLILSSCNPGAPSPSPVVSSQPSVQPSPSPSPAIVGFIDLKLEPETITGSEAEKLASEVPFHLELCKKGWEKLNPTSITENPFGALDTSSSSWIKELEISGIGSVHLQPETFRRITGGWGTRSSQPMPLDCPFPEHWSGNWGGLGVVTAPQFVNAQSCELINGTPMPGNLNCTTSVKSKGGLFDQMNSFSGPAHQYGLAWFRQTLQMSPDEISKVKEIAQIPRLAPLQMSADADQIAFDEVGPIKAIGFSRSDTQPSGADATYSTWILTSSVVNHWGLNGKTLLPSLIPSFSSNPDSYHFLLNAFGESKAPWLDQFDLWDSTQKAVVGGTLISLKKGLINKVIDDNYRATLGLNQPLFVRLVWSGGAASPTYVTQVQISPKGDVKVLFNKKVTSLEEWGLPQDLDHYL